MDEGEGEKFGEFFTTLGCGRCTARAAQCHLLVIDGQGRLTVAWYEGALQLVDEVLEVRRVTVIVLGRENP